jgi:hypothetical protein
MFLSIFRSCMYPIEVKCITGTGRYEVALTVDSECAYTRTRYTIPITIDYIHGYWTLDTGALC